MVEHFSEEEQIETLKRWWKENGTSLVIGVALAVSGYFGWQYWQDYQQHSREDASSLFNDMMEAGIPDPGQQLTEQDITAVKSIAGELMSKYKSSLYAQNAAMLLAKIAVDQNDLPAAETNLRWVLDNSSSDNVEALANLRLAMVLYAEEKYADALQLVKAAPDDSFTSRYAEVRGDILLAQGNSEDAKTAYQLALDNLLQSQGSRRDMIQMKITDIDSSLAAAPNSEMPSTAADSSATENGSTENNTTESSEPTAASVETNAGQGE